MAVLTSIFHSSLELLLERRSVPRTSPPGPTDDELAVMLRAASRAPDFQHLKPYRFLLARADGLYRLGEAMQRAAIRSGKPAEVVERALCMPHRAPLVIVAISSPKTHPIVPLIDQQLCAGCALLMLQLAANALGYAGIWRTGWLASEPTFFEELGLAPEEMILGFLYLGTAHEASDRGAGADGHSFAPAVSVRWL